MRQGMVFVRAGTLNSSRADSRFAPSQWETVLLCNDVSHWLGTSLKSALLKWLGTQFWLLLQTHITSGPILGFRPANERRHYKVTPSLIGRAQTSNQPWTWYLLTNYPQLSAVSQSCQRQSVVVLSVSFSVFLWTGGLVRTARIPWMIKTHKLFYSGGNPVNLKFL